MTCFVVIGVPRSGTSCIAGVLHKLGVSMGPQLRGPDEANPTGHFVDTALEAELIKNSEQLRGLIESRCGQKRWGLKSLALLRHFDLFASLCKDEIETIVTRRPLAESIESAHKHSSQVPISVTSKWMNQYDSQVREICPVPKLVVDFHQLIDDSHRVVRQIADFVGVPVSAAATQHVDANLRHFGGSNA